ncbi:MAG: hypothetical protein LQ348_002306 [Seirophora lacunosa]|nr:MAG: hypothetical protein LQ348_002306 [Seirophora lacunosa]
MVQAVFFHGKFSLDVYNNLRTVVDVGACQTTCEDFMTLVEKNDQYLLTGKGRQLMDDFCAMGNCLQHVLSNVVDRLPARNDLHLLTTEQDMMRSRLKNQARALMTGGHTQDELCVEDEEELDALLGKFDTLVLRNPPRKGKRVRHGAPNKGKEKDGQKIPKEWSMQERVEKKEVDDTNEGSDPDYVETAGSTDEAEEYGSL